MREFPQLEAACRYGRLVITEESVAVRPASALHWSRHHWQVPREKVTGVSSYRGAYGRDLLIYTSDGHSLRAEAVAPQHALPVIHLLGHARMELPEEMDASRLERPHRWVREGKLVISPETVALKPRVLFFLRRRQHWSVPRADVTGMLTTRHPGLRMRYDVTVLTKHGERLLASNVSPDNVIVLTRQLGHITEVPAVPDTVQEDRTAVFFALSSVRELPTQGLWAAEDGGVWELEPAAGQPPVRGWGSRVSVREGTTSIRFGTLAFAVLICVYVTAALVGGRAIANGATFAQQIAAPRHTKSAPAAPRLPAPVVGSLNSPLGTSPSTVPGVPPAPTTAPIQASSH